MAVVPARAISRSLKIARLDVPTFEEVEADTSATAEAATVVVVSSVIGSLGSLFVNGFGGFIATLIILLVGWLIWGWITSFIAQKMFNVTTTDTGEMLRATGYAYAPRIIGVIPFLAIVGALWSLVAVVIGVRQAGELTTVQAIITSIIGWIAAAVGVLLINILV